MHVTRSALVALLFVAAALQVGLQYGRSNHLQYLVHGLHAADPAFLANDWFTTRTASHHGLFDSLVTMAARTGRASVVLGLLNPAATVGFGLALWSICSLIPFLSSLKPPNSKSPGLSRLHVLLPFAAALLVAVHLGPAVLGHSHILLPYFVPSVFAGVALVAAIAAYIRGFTVTAGLLSAAACAAHANYAVLIPPLWLFVLALDRCRPESRAAFSSGNTQPEDRIDTPVYATAAALLLPCLAAFVFHVPFLRELAADPAPRGQAREVFWDIYAPLHYRPHTWAWRPWADLGIFCAAGLLAARFGPVCWPRRAKAVGGAIFMLVAGGAIFTAVLPVDFVNGLFPYRLAPFLALAGIIAIAAVLFPSPAIPVARHFALAVGATVAVWLTRTPGWVCIAFGAIAGASIAAHAALSIASRGHPNPRSVGAMRSVAAGLVLLATGYAAADLLRHGLWRRDAFGAPYKAEEESLFAWARNHTPPGTTFAIPPDLTAFRLETGRAVVVDWKCMPLMPSDQLEWRRRIERMAGGTIKKFEDAVDGYRQADVIRTESWALEFGCEFVVIERRHQGDFGAWPVAFRNDRYEVRRLPETGTAALGTSGYNPVQRTSAHGRTNPPRGAIQG